LSAAASARPAAEAQAVRRLALARSCRGVLEDNSCFSGARYYVEAPSAEVSVCLGFRNRCLRLPAHLCSSPTVTLSRCSLGFYQPYRANYRGRRLASFQRVHKRIRHHRIHLVCERSSHCVGISIGLGSGVDLWPGCRCRLRCTKHGSLRKRDPHNPVTTSSSQARGFTGGIPSHQP
jgi:hypothetical protein